MASNSLLWIIRVSKKTEESIKLKKSEKNNWKNRTEKKLIKPIKFFKKPAGSVRFRFYKQKTEKTEPKPTKNRKNNWAKPEKPSQTEKTKPNRAKTGKNRAKTEKTEPKPEKPSQTGLNRFLP